MLLKKKNNLIKQKRFLPLYLKSPLFFGFFRKLEKGKSQGLKDNSLKTLNSILDISKYSFLENNQRFKHKQIQAYFRNVISDQKKRSAFAKHELKKVVLKTLLSVNQKTFLFTRRLLFNSLCPFYFYKKANVPLDNPSQSLDRGLYWPKGYKTGSVKTKKRGGQTLGKDQEKNALRKPKVGGPKLRPHESLSQKIRLKTILQFSSQGSSLNTKTHLLKVKSIGRIYQDTFAFANKRSPLSFNCQFKGSIKGTPVKITEHLSKAGSLIKRQGRGKKNTRGAKDFNSRYARLGPVLFLEKTINPQFIEKIKSFSRIRNRCLLSGRSSIVGKYRLSRICFRHYVNRGLIPGLLKNKN